ncbi:MAG: hypothetical protein WCL50_11680 [Spirochaetota bacterium]
MPSNLIPAGPPARQPIPASVMIEDALRARTLDLPEALASIKVAGFDERRPFAGTSEKKLADVVRKPTKRLEAEGRVGAASKRKTWALESRFNLLVEQAMPITPEKIPASRVSPEAMTEIGKEVHKVKVKGKVKRERIAPELVTLGICDNATMTVAEFDSLRCDFGEPTVKVWGEKVSLNQAKSGRVY